MYKTGDNLTWQHVNELLFSFAAVLTPERQQKFYDQIRQARIEAFSPDEVFKVVIKYIKEMV